MKSPKSHCWRGSLSTGAKLALALLLALPLVEPLIADPSGDGDATFVTPPSRPSQVVVGVYLIGLSEISEPSDPFPTYECELFLSLSWRDQRVAFEDEEGEPHVYLEAEAEERLREIWSPDLVIQNEVEQRRTENLDLVIHPDGTVEYEERFGATLNADLDLRRFPFDRQVFEVEIESFAWDRTELEFVSDEARIGFDPDFATPEWRITGVDAVVGSRSEMRDDREFSSFTFQIAARRESGHYLIRIFLPVLFVMALTWAAFWEPAGGRIRVEVGFIALLTVVATHTVISGNLPRIGHPTLADALLFVCYLFAASLTVLSIVVHRMHNAGESERADRVDRRVRWLVPVGALLILTVSAVALWI